MISHHQALSHCSNSFGLTSCITLFEEEERTFAFRKQSFAARVDVTGRKYVYQEKDELDKNHRENDDSFDSSGDGRMYENANNPKLCPIRAFELYLSKLHPLLNLLWQRPKALERFNESDSVWYCNSVFPLGKKYPRIVNENYFC